MRPTTDELIGKLRTVVARHAEVRLALLYGSRARGDHRPSSDVDVAVAGADFDTASLAGELSLATDLEVDVVPLADPGVPLLERLVDESVVVYEAERGTAAHWRTAALLALETDRPWYRRMRDAFLARIASTGV